MKWRACFRIVVSGVLGSRGAHPTATSPMIAAWGAALLEGPLKADRGSEGSSVGTRAQVPVHRTGAGRFCTQGDEWRPVFRLPVGDHEVLVRFESIQVAQNLVINNVLS